MCYIVLIWILIICTLANNILSHPFNWRKPVCCIPSDKINFIKRHSHSHSTNFGSWNSHSTNANFEQLRDVTICDGDINAWTTCCAAVFNQSWTCTHESPIHHSDALLVVPLRHMHLAIRFAKWDHCSSSVPVCTVNTLMTLELPAVLLQQTTKRRPTTCNSARQVLWAWTLQHQAEIYWQP